nr:unnamed protein product [Callosobruchus chinensis]
MAPRYKSRGIRGKWTEENMQKALAAVKRGVMKIYTASKHFDIPRRTLKRYLVEKKVTKSSLGRKPLLSIEQENDLKSRVIRLCDVGYPLTSRTLRLCVKNFCDLNNITVLSKGIMIGRDWLRGFLKRHKDLSLRKAQNLNPARAQKLNKAVVADYFHKLKKILEDNDLLNRPECIYNIDEKGCQLNLHNAPQVLAKRGTKRVHFVAHEHGENVTVVSCGNALGQAIPPMILFKGKRLKPEWKDALPSGTTVQMTPKGSMNVAVFVQWIHHLAKYKLPGPCVVVFDGAKCHLDYSIVEAAEKFDIKLFCLPSNTTHELQPMDKSVFRSFEYFWDEEVLKYWAQHEDRRITKQRFGVIFSKVWDKAMTPANIKAGFEATGIYPFDPTKISEEMYAPSVPTYAMAPEVAVNATVEDSSSSEDDLPLAALISSKNKAPISLESSSKRTNEESAVSSISEVMNVEVPMHKYPDPGQSVIPAEDRTVECSVPLPSISQDMGFEQPILNLRASEENNFEDLFPTADSIYETTEDLPVTLFSEDMIIEPPVQSLLPFEDKGMNAFEDKTFNDSVVAPLGRDNDFVEVSQNIIKELPAQARGNDFAEVSVEASSTTADVSFKQMLKTPQKLSSPRVALRKKAVNSLAQAQTRNIFPKKEDINKTTKRSKEKEKTDGKELKRNKGKALKEKPSNESWYCFLCQEDRIAGMRLCIKCATYVHEECVGLTASNKDNFICVRCEDQ